MGVLRNRRAMAVLSPALFLLLWELAVRAGLISLDTFTSPVQVFWALKEIAFGENLALRGRLDTHMLASLESVLLGFLVATAVGVPLGILLGWSEVLHNFFDPVVELLRPIPPMAWVPLSLLLLGIGLQQKVFVVFLGTFAPTLISTVGGAKNLDPLILKVAQTHNASQVDTLFKVYLPALLPTIFTTCRVGLGLAWMVVVAAELVAAEAGLGFLLIQAYRVFRMDVMVAVMAIIGLTAFAMDRLMRWVQPRVIRWQG